MTGPAPVPVPRSQVLDILTTVLAPNQESVSLPDRLCAECVRTLGISGAGLIVMSDQEHLGVAAVTDGPAAQLEDLQFATGEGPCVDASRTGRPVLQPDLRSTAVARWPGFGSAVLDTSIRAIFAFPLQIGAIRIGVLDLYRDKAGQLTDTELAAALGYADAATLILLHLQDHQDGKEPTHMIDAIDSHAVVHQATGMIAVQLGVTLTEALLRLRGHAYTSDLSLANIAADVVSRRMRFVDSDSGTLIREGLGS